MYAKFGCLDVYGFLYIISLNFAFLEYYTMNYWEQDGVVKFIT
jgi:hypothetical protein